MVTRKTEVNCISKQNWMECDTGIFKKTLNGSKQNADKLIIEATNVFNVLNEFDCWRNQIIIFSCSVSHTSIKLQENHLNCKLI